MADGFSVAMHGVKEIKAALDARQTRMDRGAMWAVRQTGRVAAKAAKAKAPVYKGGMTQKAFKADRAGAGIHAPVSGLLRSSIKPSRKINRAGGTMTLYVVPRGARVQLYRAKIEGQAKYMAAGRDAALAAAREIWVEAARKSMGN